jgi:hypothetical protein
MTASIIPDKTLFIAKSGYIYPRISSGYNNSGLSKLTTVVRIYRDNKYWLVLSEQQYLNNLFGETRAEILDELYKRMILSCYNIMQLYKLNGNEVLDPNQESEEERMTKLNKI